MTYKEYTDKRSSLMNEAKTLMNEGKMDEFKAKKEEIETLDSDWEAYTKAKASMEALEDRAPKKNPLVDLENGEPVDNTRVNRKVDIFDTAEYKNAFMEYVCRGERIPDKFKNEAAKTTTGDAGAVIPTTIVKEIIKEMKSFGNIYAKVRKLNVQGGVQFPILTLKPKAKWVGEESSESQKIVANEKISFSYYGLECKISQTLLASIVTFEEFQDLFVQLATEAIVEELEASIIKGTGSGQPLGIVKDTRVPSTNIISMTAEEFDDWASWKKKVFKKMKKAYRRGDFIMAQSSFDAHIDAMTDKNGQPIGRVNYGIDGSEVYRFAGKTVETVEEEILPDFDTAEVGEVVAIFGDLGNYAVNGNMEMTTVKWIDNDSNELKNKVLTVVDGKILDPNGFLIIKKKASTGQQTTPTQTESGGASENL